ncbi:MAG: hypothetical protein SFV54_05215, partial [Bryobacteraceae bacterium]|nr:hypothetical protein [Bryobacteraceae bacterium]
LLGIDRTIFGRYVLLVEEVMTGTQSPTSASLNAIVKKPGVPRPTPPPATGPSPASPQAGSARFCTSPMRGKNRN